MGYYLSRLAEQDIIELFLDGAERFGVLQAEVCHDLLAHTFKFLADNPKAARLREEIDPPVRIHPVQSHLVIYQVVDSDKPLAPMSWAQRLKRVFAIDMPQGNLS